MKKSIFAFIIIISMFFVSNDRLVGNVSAETGVTPATAFITTTLAGRDEIGIVGLNNPSLKNVVVPDKIGGKDVVMVKLNCRNITSIDVSRCLKLEILECNANELTLLNVTKNTKLKELWCTSNNIESLNIRNNVNLEILRCECNQLRELDISKNTKLKDLCCQGNFIQNTREIQNWNNAHGNDIYHITQYYACIILWSGSVSNSFYIGSYITLMPKKSEYFITDDSTITLALVSSKCQAQATLTGNKLTATTPGRIVVSATIKRHGTNPGTFVYEYEFYADKIKSTTNSSTSDSQVSKTPTSKTTGTDSSIIDSSVTDSSVTDSSDVDSLATDSSVQDPSETDNQKSDDSQQNYETSNKSSKKSNTPIAVIISLSIIFLVALSGAIFLIIKKNKKEN